VSGRAPARSFRGIRERNLQDQILAIEAGYQSVTEYAIDELARRLIALEEAVYGPSFPNPTDNDPED
jgi:hypothetical protein